MSRYLSGCILDRYSGDDVQLTIKDIESMGYKPVKTSIGRGYCSRRVPGVLQPYNGRYGCGYAYIQPFTTLYVWITYYIKGD